MQAEQRYLTWWYSLTDAEQAEALTVTGELPPWMLESLDRAGILVVHADLNGHSPVALMPTSLREFMDRETQRANDRVSSPLRWPT